MASKRESIAAIPIPGSVGCPAGCRVKRLIASFKHRQRIQCQFLA